MRNTLAEMSARFIENRDAIKTVFHWESEYVLPVCAACYGDRSVDTEALRRTAADIKRAAGVFSPFRGRVRPVVAAMLAQEADPPARLKETLQAYELLRHHFSSSDYLPMAALILARLADDPRQAADKTRRVYECMKRDHSFLTSAEDSVFAALLALSPMDPTSAEREAEDCYELLRRSFSRGNGLQSLSHVLALGEGSTLVKCDRAIALYDELKRTTVRFSRDLELPVLGALALLDRDIQQLAEDLCDADEYLSQQKGYGFFGLSASMRRMHAAMITINEASEKNAMQMSNAAAGMAGIYAAQQAAMMAAVTASTTAAAAASSSSC